MTDDYRPDSLDGVPARAAEAAAALEALREPAERTALAIEDAFGRAGASLTRSLARAAADGEVTLAELARAVLSAVGAGLSGPGTGLGAAIAQAVAGLAGFGGARADGGPVTGGGAYLVGDGAGDIPAGGGGGRDREWWQWQWGDRKRHARWRCPRLAEVGGADRADAGQSRHAGGTSHLATSQALAPSRAAGKAARELLRPSGDHRHLGNANELSRSSHARAPGVRIDGGAWSVGPRS